MATKKKSKPAKKKPAKKAAAKKKSKPAKKAAKTTKKKQAAPSASAPSAAFEAVVNFPPALEAFCALVNSGGAGDADLEGYASFNEQYKPSDWARNPALDLQMLTFAMDGAGGQFTLWRQEGRPHLENPVVQLGDDGELHVLATSFPRFVALVAAGVNLFSREVEGEPRPQLTAYLGEWWPGASYPSPSEILAEAAAAHPGFSDWMMKQTKT